MGMDLRLMFGRKNDWDKAFAFYTQIETVRDYEFQEVFRKVKSEEVPIDSRILEFCYGASDGHVLKKDKYGQEFRWTTVELLREMKFPNDTARLNKAVVQFLNFISPETIVLIGWH